MMEGQVEVTRVLIFQFLKAILEILLTFKSVLHLYASYL